MIVLPALPLKSRWLVHPRLKALVQTRQELVRCPALLVRSDQHHRILRHRSAFYRRNTNLFNRCRALHTHAVLLNRQRRIDRDLIVRRVSRFHSQSVALKLNVPIPEDQPISDEPPDDSRHLVTVEFNYRVCDLDLRHGKPFDVSARRVFDLASIPSVERTRNPQSIRGHHLGRAPISRLAVHISRPEPPLVG